MKKNEIAIITSGFLPVPAARGGAVENLIENILNKNEEEKNNNFVIFSIYDKKALDKSEKYKYTTFIFIKPIFLVKCMDRICYFLARNILRKKNSQSYRYIFQRLYYLNKVSVKLNKCNYDKVILENHPTQYLALKWRKNYRKYDGRYYYHCHNEFPAEYGCHNIIAKTKRIICVSQYIEKTIKKYLNYENTFILRNGIDEKKFNYEISKEQKEKIKDKYNIKKDDKILIFSGRIVPEKGVLELIRAMNNVKIDNVKLLIVGASLNDLRFKSKYEILVEKEMQHLNGKIIFTGFVNYEEMVKLYKIADIAVLPSIWDDPAPLTIIESLICGLPIITTDSGGIPEYVNERCAVIIKRDENLIVNLSEQIINLLKDENRLLEMRKEALLTSKDLVLDRYYNEFLTIIQ